MDSVFDVTTAASGTISLITTARPDAASFSTKAVLKAAAKAPDFEGSASVSCILVASARDVVTNSYSTLSFGPCNCLSSASESLRVTMEILVTVSFFGSTPKADAREPATLATKVVSAARASAVTFSGKLPKSKVIADFTVYVVMFSMRVVVAPPTAYVVVAPDAAVVAGAAVDVVVTSG
jgi:hypothetical protein